MTRDELVEELADVVEKHLKNAEYETVAQRNGDGWNLAQVPTRKAMERGIATTMTGRLRESDGWTQVLVDQVLELLNGRTLPL